MTLVGAPQLLRSADFSEAGGRWKKQTEFHICDILLMEIALTCSDILTEILKYLIQECSSIMRVCRIWKSVIIRLIIKHVNVVVGDYDTSNIESLFLFISSNRQNKTITINLSNEETIREICKLLGMSMLITIEMFKKPKPYKINSPRTSRTNSCEIEK